MTWRIVTMPIEAESDVVAVRQRARQIAERLGFDRQDQTRIATAVSDIARNAFRHAAGGRLVQSDNRLGHALRKRGCTSFNRGGRGWKFPPLLEARAAWEARVPGQQWADDEPLQDWQERGCEGE